MLAEESDVDLDGNVGCMVNGAGTSYTATFTPTGQGACTIDVATDKFTDGASNDNTASDQFNWTYDTVVPTISITSSTKTNGSYKQGDGWVDGLSKAVTVTGTPTLTLETGSSDAVVNYSWIRNQYFNF